MQAKGVDLSGLHWPGISCPGVITPTDIDGFIDFDNRLFIVFELKTAGEKIAGGQKMALERMVDALGQFVPTYLIIATHSTPTSQDIDAASCRVEATRYKWIWHPHDDGITLREFIDRVRATWHISA